MIRVNSCTFVVEIPLFLLLVSSSFAAPKIHCAEPVWDFGEHLTGGKLVHEFVIENRGDEPLLFGTSKTCCGMTVEFPYKELLPGSHAICKATFDVYRRYGMQSKLLYIASNDPKQPYLILKMEGMLNQDAVGPNACKSDAVVLPMKVIPGEVIVKSGSGAVMRYVAVRSREPFQILSADLKNCDGTVEQNVIGKTGWSFGLKLNVASIEPGAHLALRTDPPRMPGISIPIRRVE